MTENQSAVIDRLEARLGAQTARIDALYRVLGQRGMLPGPAETEAGNAFFDELVQIEETLLAQEVASEPTRRRATRLHVGNATGV